LLLAVGTMLFARPGIPRPARNERPEKKVVDLKADVMYPIEYEDTSAVCLVGNVAFFHSGTVITCDSAVRYNDRHMECFGRVLINKDDTFIYGDRAEYDGDTHVAQVYSDLIKVVDGDATLYTHTFRFNTQTSIGEFAGGGAVAAPKDTLESDRGYYYADDRRVICVDRVQIRTEAYDLTGDSVIYDLSTDHAYYFARTHIWNAEGDYLYADRGEYEKEPQLYRITRNGYILTAAQEVWSDSLDYYRAAEYALLRRDIQIDDTEHKVLAFGDWGEYWKNPGDAFLTQRPCVISYDRSQGGDSLFLAADSMYLYTIDSARGRADSLPASDSLGLPAADSAVLAERLDGAFRPLLDSTFRPSQASAAVADDDGAPRAEQAVGEAAPETTAPSASAAGISPAAVAPESSAAFGRDSLATLPPDSLAAMDKAQRRAWEKARVRQLREAAKARKAADRKRRSDEVARRRLQKSRAKLDAQRTRDSLRRLGRKHSGAETFGDADSLKPVESTPLSGRDSVSADTLSHDVPTADGAPDSLAADTLGGDSVYRLVKAFRRVRIYRTDFQAVCDSLVGLSSDSTAHLYIDPVIWNQNNQITSDVVDLYTRSRELQRAEFVGHPMMIARLDSMYYNQVAGKEMTAWFRDNDIYRNDVDGNAQTIYYMQEEGSPEVIGLTVVESGNMSFFIDRKEITGIVYRQDPTYTIYPMDKIPPGQDLFLNGFKWESARRPTRESVFGRRIRPSQRAVRSELPRPDFPIMQQIDRERRMLAETAGWIDREDRVAPEVEEWVRSLGY